MIRAAPTTDPITIPAMAPPESLFPPPEDGELVGLALEVDVGRLTVDVMVGSTTLAQTFSASEL